MITDILISAGGKGTRMKHLSQNMPKHMIDVQGRPFLHYLLDNVMKAGFKKIYLVVGYKKENIERFAAQHPEYPITLIDQFGALPDKYGTACPLICAEEYLSDKQFISIAGDNYYAQSDLRVMMAHNDELCYVGGLRHDHPEQHGVLVVNKENILERIAEKSQEHVGNVINSSLYKFTPDIFTAIHNVGLSPRGEYEITDALSALAQRGKVRVEHIKDSWMDFGKPEDVERMAELLKTEQCQQ